MALVVTYIGAAYWSGGSSAPTLTSVSLNAGELLVAFCLQDAPFAGRSVSSATWGASGLTSAIELVGSGGGSYDWIAGAAFYLQAGSTASNTITFNLSGSAARGVIVAYKATGFDTSTPIGATGSSMSAVAAQSLTLSGSAGDVALYGVTNDQQSSDRWVEGNNSITENFNNDPRPGNLGLPKIAVGSKSFSGSSCTLGFTSRGFDAGPIDDTVEKLAIGLVIKQASGGGGGGTGDATQLMNGDPLAEPDFAAFDDATMAAVLASGAVIVGNPADYGQATALEGWYSDLDLPVPPPEQPLDIPMLTLPAVLPAIPALAFYSPLDLLPERIDYEPFMASLTGYADVLDMSAGGPPVDPPQSTGPGTWLVNARRRRRR